MAQHNWTWTTERSLASSCGAHCPLMNEILDQLKRIGWSDRELFGVQMALEESLSNAIRHGNQLDEHKKVEVACKISPERFWLRVEDEGCGFIPANVPDCTRDQNITACGGRGLMLIKAYMTRVEYNAKGNCVTMERIRGDTDSSLVDVSS